MRSKVSLYIPCYNVEQYLAPVIEGVLRQTVVPDEILIIDDGCTDGTLEIAARFPVRVIRHEINRGLAAACNTGVRNSRNDLVASVSADVVPEADWLEKLIVPFKDPSIALAGGKLREGVLVSVADLWRQAHMSMDWGNERVLNPPFVYGCNVLVRKKAVEEVGGYNEKCLRAGEDVDISTKIRAKGYNTFYEPSAHATHTRHDTVHSVMATYWRWCWHEIETMSLGYALLRARSLHRVKAFELFKTDLRRRRYGLLWLDLLTLFYMPYFDWSLYLKATPLPARNVTRVEAREH